ncbi:hypothetical protein BYT27DRAFT_7186433, partial [Phlegmacium glaucopus]
MAHDASFSNDISLNRDNSSWECRLLCETAIDGVDDYFSALVTTIKVTADIKEESSWWGLQNGSSENFSAEINAMQLPVVISVVRL